MTNAMSLLYALPYELTCNVLRCLPPKDLKTFALVNKQAHSFAYDSNVFRSVAVHSADQLATVKYSSIQVLEINCENMDSGQLTKLVSDVINGPYASTIVHLKLYRTSHTIDISSLVNRMDKLDKITITGTAPPIAINPMYRSLDKLTVVMDASHTSAFVSPGRSFNISNIKTMVLDTTNTNMWGSQSLYNIFETVIIRMEMPEIPPRTIIWLNNGSPPIRPIYANNICVQLTGDHASKVKCALLGTFELMANGHLCGPDAKRTHVCNNVEKRINYFRAAIDV